jgi:hypothetical protein
MSAWKGIIGQAFTVEEFRAYVAGLAWDAWRPEFIVLHNIQQLTAPGGLSADYLQEMAVEYRALGWSGGPHLFVDSERIWVFTPLTTPGVHAPGWNNISLGVEMEGDYDREEFDSGRGLAVQQNAVAAVAILSAALGLDPETMRLHKEDPYTEHDYCPGVNVDKAAFIEAVRGAMA